MNPTMKGGKSPVRSVQPGQVPIPQFHATANIQPTRDPRIPFAHTNRDASSPTRALPQGIVQGAYSPRDPRIPQYNPYAFPAVTPVPHIMPQYITHPIQYSQLSPEYPSHPYMYGGIPPAALPPPPYISPRRQQVSRSQPASRRRRSSLSSVSSDSDDAEQISARIMAASSEDPRELRSIIKSTRGQNRSLRRHRTDISPRVRVDHEPFPRDRSVPSMLDEFSDVFRTDGSPYDSIYKSRRNPSRREDRSRKPKSRPDRSHRPRSRTLSADEDTEIPAAVDAETWFNPEQSPERDEPPAVPPPPPARKSSSGRRRDGNSSSDRRRRRRSISEQPRRNKRQDLTTTVAHAAAIVPVDDRQVSRPRKMP